MGKNNILWEYQKQFVPVQGAGREASGYVWLVFFNKPEKIIVLWRLLCPKIMDVMEFLFRRFPTLNSKLSIVDRLHAASAFVHKRIAISLYACQRLSCDQSHFDLRSVSRATSAQTREHLTIEADFENYRLSTICRGKCYLN